MKFLIPKDDYGVFADQGGVARVDRHDPLGRFSASC